MRRLALLALVTLLAVVPVRRAHARPVSSDWSLIRNDATTVVIGTMVPGQGLTIDVDTVIRGSAKLGPRRLVTSPDGTSEATGRVVAFIDKNDAFRWVGVLEAGPTIEAGVLRLSGFYDSNAHFVSPGVMTLPQLRGALATGVPLTYQFAATITLADTTGGYVASGTTFTFDHDTTTHTTTLHTPVGACLGAPSIHGLERGSLMLRLSDTCPPPTATPRPEPRELELEGRITGVDASGTFACELSPRRPFLDAKDFHTFIADPTVVAVKRLVDVRLSDGTTWTWDLGNRLIAPDGTLHEARGISSHSLTQNGLTSHSATYGFGGPALSFDPRVSYPMSIGGDAAAVIEMIDGNMYVGCVFAEPGKGDRDCTLARGRSKIVRR